jgi:hypothetical protein
MAYIGAGITRFNTADELTVTGDAQIDGTTLVIDSTNNRVGIGTGSPSQKLSVVESGGSARMELLSGTSGTSIIDMGDTSDADIGGIRYENTNNAMLFRTNNDERLRITSGGLLGIGTSSPDHNLTLQANTNPIFEMVQVAGGPYKHQIAVGGNDLQLRASSGALIMYTGNADGASSTERMRITSGGLVGIGESSPSFDVGNTGIHIGGASSPAIRLKSTTTGSGDWEIYADSASTGGLGFYEHQNNATYMYLSEGGLLGIGTSSPAGVLDVRTGGTQQVIIGNSGTYTGSEYGELLFKEQNTELARVKWNPSGNTFQLINNIAGPMTFATNGSERMRIDSSGTLLVGKTSEAIGTAGAEFRASGHQLNMTRASGPALNVNRLTDDGDLLGFYQDSSLIGTIGTNGDRLYFTTANKGFYVDESGSEIVPSNGTGGNTNNIMNLGNSASAFKDLYLGGNLYIGGTGSSNALDDYEEGGWTPSVGGNTTYHVQSATYTKIGRAVYIWLYLQINSLGTGSTNVISGLPFTPATSNQYIGVAYYAGIYQNTYEFHLNARGDGTLRSELKTSFGTSQQSGSAWATDGAAVIGSGVYYT